MIDRQGNLKKDIRLGEGTAYHSAGIDYDGQNVWVPAAEYRPNSRAIVYTVDPKTYRVTERFPVTDHVGGVVRDRTTGQVHGVSWGSRTLYNWTPTSRQLQSVPNESHLLDYQNCDSVARGKQLCGVLRGVHLVYGSPPPTDRPKSLGLPAHVKVVTASLDSSG